MTDLIRIAERMKPIRGSGLPVFKLKDSESDIYYTPGLLAAVSSRWSSTFHSLLCGESVKQEVGHLRPAATGFLQRAREVKREYGKLRERFAPECLTLYLHNRCNLECVYCLRDKDGSPGHLRPDTVASAAEQVVRNCIQIGRTFTTVFHGWGEPTIDFPLLQSMVQIVEEKARQANCSQFRYIATNGVLSSQIAMYLASHFDLVGLSCDGPADIQNRQRPVTDSGASSIFVERTARILKDHGVRFSVRATITKETMNRQEEIAEYILTHLSPSEMYFEPAYRTGEFQAEDAEEFLNHYRKAATLASAQNVSFCFSGSRMFDVHGSYCNVFRSVLNLTPENEATACFASSEQSRFFRIGKLQNGTFSIFHNKIRKLQALLSRLPENCRNCFNQFHCVRVCPESCPAVPVHPAKPEDNFRCRLQKLFGISEILAHVKTREHNQPIKLNKINLNTLNEGGVSS